MAIIGSLPYTLTNGTTADATQVMADLNTIINGVNANAAAITSVQQASYNYAADTGTVNAIVIPMSPGPASYTDGLRGYTKVANTNTSTAVTVKFGSLAAVAVVLDQAGTLPPANSIIAGMHYTFEYDSTQSKIILINPQSSNAPGSQLPTATGTANALVITNTPAFGAFANGQSQWVNPASANTAAATAAVDGQPAKNIFWQGHALVGGELQPGIPALLKSDGTNWNLQNSARGPVNDFYVDSGAVNAVAITANIGQTTYANLVGGKFKIKMANTTTNSTPTLNINGIGATLNLVGQDNSTGVLAGGLVSGNSYDVLITSATTAQVINPTPITGSFTITLTGMASATTGTINYILPGWKTAYVHCAANISNTSNTTAMTGTGIPSILSSSSLIGGQTIWIVVEDNTATSIGAIQNLNSTTWTFLKGITQTTWTSAGTKGLNPFEASYTL